MRFLLSYVLYVSFRIRLVFSSRIEMATEESNQKAVSPLLPAIDTPPEGWKPHNGLHLVWGLHVSQNHGSLNL